MPLSNFNSIALAADNKERVILAVEDLGGLVTASDVALNTGLPLPQVRFALQQIAFDTSSHLAVTESGEICFKFASNLADIYAAKDRALRLAQMQHAALDIVFFLARVLFGLTLLFSIWLFKPGHPRLLGFYILLIFGGAWMEREYGQQFRKDGPEEKWMSLADAVGLGNLINIFSWRYRHRKRKIENVWELLKAEDEEARYSKASFFNVCFSFVFGDGKPNEQFEELQWQVVAEVIRQNNGAVVVEQLAPYLCCPPDDEDSILAALVRFDGQPHVMEGGHLVYLFPELMKSKGANFRMPLFLTERSWKFSELPFTSIAPVWLVSSLMLLVSYFNFLHPDFFGGQSGNILPQGFTNWHFVFPFSLFFSLVPACRFFAIWMYNSEIDERNKLRAYFAELLEHPESLLAAKLELARQYQLQENLTTVTDKFSYTTEEDLLEQEPSWHLPDN